MILQDLQSIIRRTCVYLHTNIGGKENICLQTEKIGVSGDKPDSLGGRYEYNLVGDLRFTELTLGRRYDFLDYGRIRLPYVCRDLDLQQQRTDCVMQ